MMNLLHRLSWKTLFLLLGLMVAVRVILELI